MLSLTDIHSLPTKRFYQAAGSDIITDIDNNFTALMNAILQKTVITVGHDEGADFCTADYASDDLAFTAASDYLVTRNGGTILGRIGEYDVQNTIQLKPKVNIIGEGFGTIFKSHDGLNSFPLRAQYSNLVDDILLSNFKVDMNGDNQSSNGWVALTGITNFVLDRLWFYNPKTFAVLAQQDGDPITGNHAQYGLVYRCRFDTRTGTSSDFAILNLHHSKIIANHWGECSAGSSSNYALSAGRGMRDCLIALNTFENPNMDAIGLEDILDCIVAENRVTGDLTKGNHGIFIKTFEPGFNVERVTVVNNTVTGCKDDGMSLGGGAGGARIKDSIITGNLLYGNGRDGMSINGADDCTFAFNTCKNNNQVGATAAPVGSGMRFAGGTPTNNTVAFNKLYDDQGTPTQNWGLYTGNGNNFQIFGNSFRGNLLGPASLAKSEQPRLGHSSCEFQATLEASFR